MHKIKNLAADEGSLLGPLRYADFFLRIAFDSGGRGPYHARAMGNPLQQRRTPQDFAKDAQVFEISGKVGEFEQLTAIVAADLAALDAAMMPLAWRDREITGELKFVFLDAQSTLPALQGQLNATIDAVCQRCLAPFGLSLTSELRWLFGGESAIEYDGEQYEIWELEREDLLLAELVEEALIMAIPFVAMHNSDGSCVAEDAPDESTEKMTLPFAGLKEQMEQEN